MSKISNHTGNNWTLLHWRSKGGKGSPPPQCVVFLLWGWQHVFVLLVWETYLMWRRGATNSVFSHGSKSSHYVTASGVAVGPGKRGGKDCLVVINKNSCKNIATGKIKSVVKLGKLENIVKDTRQLNINFFGLDETSWKEEKEFQSHKCQEGITFVLNKLTSHALMNVGIYNLRDVDIRTASTIVDVMFIQTNTPTTKQDEEEVEENNNLLNNTSC